jgi:hypothetical protein
VSELTDTYRRVQEMKEEPWQPPREAMAAMSQAFKAALLRSPSNAELKVMAEGFGWVQKMAGEQCLNLLEVVQIAMEIESNTRANLLRVQTELSAHDQLGAGVGAGFFTGLWVGLLLGDIG